MPLFVKAPAQTRGRVNGALAQTLDVTPTIADVLNVPLGYRADGRSAFSRAVRARRQVRLTTRDFSSIVRMSAGAGRRTARAVVRRRLRHLGSGDWASLYTSLGPHRELIGQDVGERAQAAPACGDDLAVALIRARAARQRRRAVRRSRAGYAAPDRARARPRDRREWPNRGCWAKLPPQGRSGGELCGHGSGGCSARGPQHGGGARGNR